MPISINGSGTISGISAGGLPDGCITEADLSTAAVTTDKIAAQAVTPAKTTGGPAFSATGGNQTLASATQTKVICNTEQFDTSNSYDPSIGRFTPNVAGYYQVNIGVQYTGTVSANTIFTVKLYKNGSEFFEVAVFQTDQYKKSLSPFLLYLNGSTDYIEFYAAQFTGVSKTIGECVFSGFLARPA